MGLRALFSSDAFPSLVNTDAYFERLLHADGTKARINGQILLLTLFLFAYGVVMGAYHSPLQAVVAGVKLPALVMLSLLICFPAFFIVQFILGSRLKLIQMAPLILSGFLLMSAIMLSFVPIVIIFLLTGSDYYFLHLLHIAVVVFAGVFGMNTIVQALKFSCEKKDIYPRNGVVVFRVWVMILAFVGIQLAWNLRPFIAKQGQPFELFGTYEGNFYAAVIYSVKQLADADQTPHNRRETGPTDVAPADTTRMPVDWSDSLYGH
ncbi:MAG: hypothetical protein AB1644_04375 [Candidatus Zixiibacteriota bacterium]